MQDVVIADEETIKSVLHRIDVKDEIRSALIGLHKGDNLQLGTVVMDLPEGKGDCLIFPASAPSIGVFGAKLSPFIPARKTKGLDPVTAYNIVLSTETGELMMVCDAGYLTKVRTAATTSLAIDSLKPDNARIAAIIGLGPVGLEHLRIESKRGYEEIRVYSPSMHKRADSVRAVNPDAIFVADLQEAVNDADVIMLCTGSPKPVLDPTILKQGALLTSVGSDLGGYEISADTLPNLDVYCDYRLTAPKKAKEFENFDGLIADLPELLSGSKTPASSGKKRYWRSCGMGLQDMAVSKALYDILK